MINVSGSFLISLLVTLTAERFTENPQWRLLLVVGFLVPYLIPLPFMALEVFVGVIQAFIFAILSAVFVALVWGVVLFLKLPLWIAVAVTAAVALAWGVVLVLRRLKADPRLRSVPVVMLTSSREERDIVESYRLGVNSYIVKPIDFEQFSESVRQVGQYWVSLNESSSSKYND